MTKTMTMLMITAAAGLTVAASPAMAKDHKGHDTSRAHSMQCAAIPANATDQLFKQFNDAWATRNPDTVTGLFARDAVLLATVSNKPRTTTADIRDYFVNFLRGAPDGQINTSTVMAGCNLLVRMGTWTVGLTNQNSGVRNNVKARYTFVYKPENGQWKIAHLHSSMLPVSE